MQRILLSALAVVLLGASTARAAEVSGRVAMPELCSPGVSPAVVTLEPAGGGAPLSTTAGEPAEVVLVDQQGLQFVPRVRAMPLGGTIRFTNADSERHSVHVQTPG